MARRKRNSTALEKANRRFESLQAISTILDFGDGLTLNAYANVINDLQAKLAAYNTALSTIDSLADAVDTAEQLTSEMSEKILLAVGSRYGKTSKEYEMAGGSRRKSSRRSLTSSSPALTSSPVISTVNTPTTNGSTPTAVN